MTNREEKPYANRLLMVKRDNLLLMFIRWPYGCNTQAFSLVVLAMALVLIRKVNEF
jgi:hypothetical protein